MKQRTVRGYYEQKSYDGGPVLVLAIVGKLLLATSISVLFGLVKIPPVPLILPFIIGMVFLFPGAYFFVRKKLWKRSLGFLFVSFGLVWTLSATSARAFEAVGMASDQALWLSGSMWPFFIGLVLLGFYLLRIRRGYLPVSRF